MARHPFAASIRLLSRANSEDKISGLSFHKVWHVPASKNGLDGVVRDLSNEIKQKTEDKERQHQDRAKN